MISARMGVRTFLPTTLLACLTWACSGEKLPAVPPLPENLAVLDARVVARIEAARAKVLAEPGSDVAWAELGMTYGSERLKSLAVECFAVAAKLEPRQPKWPYREAVTRAQLGDPAGARAAIERSLAIEDEYAPSHARRGNYLLELGELAEAEVAFRAAVRLDSSYPGGHVGLARVALQQDRASEARAILERLLEEEPADRTFRQLFLLARRQAGEVVEGGAESVVGSEDVPVWNDPWELEARAFRESPTMLRIGRLVEQKQWQEARALLDEERARGADVGETGLQYAACLNGLGQPEEALVELGRLLAVEPENTSALLQKAGILDDLGRVEQTVEILRRVTELSPSHAGAFAALGGKLAALGAHEPAAAALRRALELGQGDYDMRFQLGESLIVLKRWEEARTLFRTLTAERAGHGDAWLELAIAELRTGDLAAAEAALARAGASGNASPRLARDVEASLTSARERRARKQDGGGQ
jgi:tetratricopeptide (TPR) repeat protein